MLPPQKRRRTERTDKTLRTSIIMKNLGIIYQGLQRSQRTTVATLGLIETQHRSLVFESFIMKEPETLPVAPTRRLFEQAFQDLENQVRTLVADIEENMGVQQRRVLGIKRYIQQHGAGEECN